MTKIEFTDSVKIADKIITAIEVSPLYFVELNRIWAAVSSANKPQAALTRARILKQVVFRSSDGPATPTDADISALPVAVARDIIAALDDGQGEAGEILAAGDGVSEPILYKLGTPIRMQDAEGKSRDIIELEFLAKTYGDVEDVLAATDEVSRAVALLSTVATPVGDTSLSVLPGWALDKITTADGVAIMQLVLPNF